jgi:hypothetical protein
MKHGTWAKSKQYLEAGAVYYYAVDGNCAAVWRVKSEIT